MVQYVARGGCYDHNHVATNCTGYVQLDTSLCLRMVTAGTARPRSAMSLCCRSAGDHFLLCLWYTVPTFSQHYFGRSDSSLLIDTSENVLLGLILLKFC